LQVEFGGYAISRLDGNPASVSTLVGLVAAC
jgi:hypothetical protein